MQIDITKKILVAYFSHSGNTREIAEQIHKSAGGDIFEIQAVKPYPHDYDAVVKQAKQELDSGCKPALKTKLENIKSYDLIFMGYSIWWGTIPAPVRAFLSEYDFTGKTIAPFCTHEGSGLGRSFVRYFFKYKNIPPDLIKKMQKGPLHISLLDD